MMKLTLPFIRFAALALATSLASTAQSESISCTNFKRCGGCNISVPSSVLSDKSAEISLSWVLLGNLLNSGYIASNIWHNWSYFISVPIVLQVTKTHEGVSELVFMEKIRDITFDRGLGSHTSKINDLEPNTNYTAVAYTGIKEKSSSDPFARICFRTKPNADCPELEGKRYKVESSDGSSYFIVGGQKEREDCPGTGLSGYFTDN